MKISLLPGKKHKNKVTPLQNSIDTYLDVWHLNIKAAKKANIYKIQTFQSITLCIITNSLFYTSIHTLRTDLKINTEEKTTNCKGIIQMFPLPTNKPSKSINISAKFRNPSWKPFSQAKRTRCRDLNLNIFMIVKTILNAQVKCQNCRMATFLACLIS